MTIQECKSLLDNGVFKAYVEGRTIQIKLRNQDVTWMDYRPGEHTPNASFDNPNTEWRVKPQAREFWVIDGIAFKYPVEGSIHAIEVL